MELYHVSRISVSCAMIVVQLIAVAIKIILVIKSKSSKNFMKIRKKDMEKKKIGVLLSLNSIRKFRKTV